MDDSLNKITQLHIKHFRGFENQKLDVGDAVTIIFGKNGTSKSTLLGMIAQPFYFSSKKQTKYTSDYGADNGGVINAVQINGKPFEAKYSDIFRMSETDEQAHGNQKYEYYLKIIGKNVRFAEPLSGHSEMLLVQSQFSQETSQKKRFRLVGGGTSHYRGTGNFPHPVIYLGLSRLYPMALSNLDENKEIHISDDEKAWFDEQYRTVLSLPELHGQLSTSFPKQVNKPPYLLPNARECNYKSVSAGQDNTGQIISAILSFRRLKKQMGQDYKGGLLLIDELGATLHPSAQKNILRFLCHFAKELDIQIVATSHSLVILRESFYSKNSGAVNVVHITRPYNSLLCKIANIEDGKGYCRIKKDFFNEYESDIDRLPVLLEDNAAKDFIQCLLDPETLRNCVFPETARKQMDTAGYGNLAWLMSFAPVNDRVPFLYVFDGDVLGKGVTLQKNAVVLPGKTYPEKVLYDFFEREYDWDKNPNGLPFSGDACFEGYRCANLTLGDYSSVEQMHKAWYAAVSKPGRLGKKCSLGYKCYLTAHKDECLKFRTAFVKSAVAALRQSSDKYADVRKYFQNKEKVSNEQNLDKTAVEQESTSKCGVPEIEGIRCSKTAEENSNQMYLNL